MPHLTSADLAHDASIPASLDTLVVGAGMSGLYATWRVLDRDPCASILIFERSGRTGGRLDSDLIHFKDGLKEDTVKEEEGGMRFTLDLMDNLMALFLMLGLDKDIVPFPMGPDGNNRLYFRGHSFTHTDAAANDYALWDQLYNLAPAEQGINPSNFIDTVFNRILSVNPHFKDRPKHRTPKFWQRFRLECQWNSVLLKDWSLWNLFVDMGYSNECINLVYNTAGFNGTFLSKMNAGEAYQLLEDFSPDPNFKTLQDGYSTLPNALVQTIGAKRIFLNTQLERIDEKTEDGYFVTYTTSDEKGHRTTGTLMAKKVILALPRLALETIFLKSNVLNTFSEKRAERLWNALQTTTNQPLAKINLYYDRAWWGKNVSGQSEVEYGPNFSDFPLGSVYPFYAIDEANTAALEYENWLEERGKTAPADLQAKMDRIADKKYHQPAALTIYCDYLNINFWRALQENGPRFDSEMQREYSGRKHQNLFPASRAVVETATEFFKLLFNSNYVPRPVLTSVRIWEGSPLFGIPPGEQFGYGVHQWGLHADDADVIPFLIEPLEGLYTCGEAFSDYQGWVEGALRSTNLVLNKAFGLDPISTVYEEIHGVPPSAAVKISYEKNSAALIRKYIDPNFPQGQEGEPAAAQTVRKRKLFTVKLTYFDEGRP
ncbi:MAG TPA: FAD-dependent oxidoreductase [Thermoanaerobaculia bacterium]|jgi:monoamine oxidase|nr:FAD-dependent oxidoreductase [Thermoanaerobaculia bacterium]